MRGYVQAMGAVLVAVSALAAPFAAPARAIAAPAEAAETKDVKIGFVDMAKIFEGYEKTKAAEAALQKKGQQKQAELQARLADIQKLRDSMEVLQPEAREAKAREFEEKTDAAKRFRNNTARDLQRERNTMASNLIKEIDAAVKEYAKANGFSMILDDRTILFSQGGVTDVSAGVLQLLNAKHAKAASAAR